MQPRSQLNVTLPLIRRLQRLRRILFSPNHFERSPTHLLPSTKSSFGQRIVPVSDLVQDMQGVIRGDWYSKVVLEDNDVGITANYKRLSATYVTVGIDQGVLVIRYVHSPNYAYVRIQENSGDSSKIEIDLHNLELLKGRFRTGGWPWGRPDR